MKITIRSWFGAELEVIEDVKHSDMTGIGNDMCGFSIKNKSFDIETTTPSYFKDVLHDRLKENKDINFFVKEQKQKISYNLLAFYNE